MLESLGTPVPNQLFNWIWMVDSLNDGALLMRYIEKQASIIGIYVTAVAGINGRLLMVSNGNSNILRYIK